MNVTSLFRSPVADAVRQAITAATAGTPKRAEQTEPAATNAAPRVPEMGPPQHLGRSAADHAVRLAMNSIAHERNPHPEATRPDDVAAATAAEAPRAMNAAALERLVRPVVAEAVHEALEAAAGREVPAVTRGPETQPEVAPVAELAAPPTAVPLSRIDLREMIGRIVREALTQVFSELRSNPQFVDLISRIPSAEGDDASPAGFVEAAAKDRVA